MREWRLWPAISGNRNRCRANETSLFLSATLPRRSSYPAIAPWPAAPPAAANCSSGGESVLNLFPACAFLRAVVRWVNFLEKPFRRLLDLVFAPP